MARTKLNLDQIEQGEALREILSWFRKIKEAGFAEKLDALWKETRQAGDKAGYGPKDVERLIAEVRKGNGAA